MAETIITTQRFHRTGFRVFVNDGRVLKVVANSLFPKGETPNAPLTTVEADTLIQSQWGFEVEVVGDGIWVADVDGEQRFIGTIVGYNWRARNAAQRDRRQVEWSDGTPTRRQVQRSRLAGSRRFPMSERRDASVAQLRIVERT